MKNDAFDLEKKMNTPPHTHTYMFVSELDFSIEPSKCYVKNLKEYFT